jgi:hypothetical protein
MTSSESKFCSFASVNGKQNSQAGDLQRLFLRFNLRKSKLEGVGKKAQQPLSAVGGERLCRIIRNKN